MTATVSGTGRWYDGHAIPNTPDVPLQQRNPLRDNSIRSIIAICRQSPD